MRWRAESDVRVSRLKSELHRLPPHLAMASARWEICSTWTVAEDSSFQDFVSIRDVRSSSDGNGASEKIARLRLLPGPEKQSCEVTVKFLQQQHAIHSIEVLSTARTCEVYRQTEGDTDAEYLSTARGQLEEEEQLYRTEMEMEDPDHCTSVTIRLLSVQDKSQVIIGHILILVSPGPYLAGASAPAPAPAPSPSPLEAFAPFMLQMAAQGFSNNGAAQSQQRGSVQELAMRALSLKQQPESKPEASLDDVCQRLERLESVCTRMETSLSRTLEAFDKRLQLLESKSSGT